jgi:hypothetical protein
MNGKSGNSLATLLLAIPMTAIAVMGVLGVPQIAPVNASPDQEAVIRRPLENSPASSAPHWGEPASQAESASPWAQLPEETPRKPHWLEESTTQTDAPLRTADLRGPARNHAAAIPSATGAAPQLVDWREAARRLAEKGIDRYHLERGANPDSFLFVCLVTPAGDQSVLHRFEAEDSDPLVAVNAVLKQIDGWLQDRYALQSFPGHGAVSVR